MSDDDLEIDELFEAGLWPMLLTTGFVAVSSLFGHVAVAEGYTFAPTPVVGAVAVLLFLLVALTAWVVFVVVTAALGYLRVNVVAGARRWLE